MTPDNLLADVKAALATWDKRTLWLKTSLNPGLNEEDKVLIRDWTPTIMGQFLALVERCEKAEAERDAALARVVELLKKVHPRDKGYFLPYPPEVTVNWTDEQWAEWEDALDREMDNERRSFEERG